MKNIPLGTSDYQRPAARNPDILLENVYFENDPTNQVDGSSLIRRPGLQPLLEVGDGPIRKIYYRKDLFNNDFFCASGTELYRVARTGATTFTTTLVDDILEDTGNISMVASGDNLFITDETTFYYTDGVNPFVEVVTPDGVGISHLAYIGGYIICVVKDSQRFYWILPGDVTINALNFAEAEGAPDGIVNVLVLGDQIYFFGKDTLEIWYLSGDQTAPFQRIQGKLLEAGAVPYTGCIIPGEDILAFVGRDGTLRQAPSLQKLSNTGIEERLRRAIRLDILANL